MPSLHLLSGQRCILSARLYLTVIGGRWWIGSWCVFAPRSNECEDQARFTVRLSFSLRVLVALTRQCWWGCCPCPNNGIFCRWCGFATSPINIVTWSIWVWDGSTIAARTRGVMVERAEGFPLLLALQLSWRYAFPGGMSAWLVCLWLMIRKRVASLNIGQVDGQWVDMRYRREYSALYAEVTTVAEFLDALHNLQLPRFPDWGIFVMGAVFSASDLS